MRTHKKKYKGFTVVWKTIDGVIVWCNNWVYLWNMTGQYQ